MTPICRHEEKNASWEAVQLLPQSFKLNDKEVSIEKYKIEVKYDAVDEIIEKIWALDFDLVIHVGVSIQASKIQLEKCAMNGFCSSDYGNKKLQQPIVCLENSGHCSILKTTFDVEKIANFLNENHKPIFSASCDAGSYLCAYIYLKSLDKNPTKSLFVHVPVIDKIPSEETSRAIQKIIECCLLQLNDQK